MYRHPPQPPVGTDCTALTFHATWPLHALDFTAAGASMQTPPGICPVEGCLLRWLLDCYSGVVHVNKCANAYTCCHVNAHACSFVATGQQKNVGPDCVPFVAIWDVDNCNLIQRLDHEEEERRCVVSSWCCLVAAAACCLWYLKPISGYLPCLSSV